MKTIWNAVQVSLAAVGAYIGYFLGGWDGFLYALVVFVVVDYLTGYDNLNIMKRNFQNRD